MKLNGTLPEDVGGGDDDNKTNDDDSELVKLNGTLPEKIKDNDSDKARATRQSRTRDTERRPRSQPMSNSLLLD